MSALNSPTLLQTFVSVLAFFCLWQTSLSANDVAEKVDYSRDIRKILSENCFTCHGPDENAREADLRLDRASEATANS